LLLSYGWPKFALNGQIMPFLKSFELGQKLFFFAGIYGQKRDLKKTGIYGQKRAGQSGPLKD